LTAQERERIHAAVTEIERSTAADLDIVVVRASDRYPHYPLIWAAIAGLALTSLAVALDPAMDGRAAIVLELLIVVVLTLLFDWLPIRLRLVPARVKRAHARHLAHREFAAQYAGGGPQPSRILLFVSLGERYVEIIADHQTHAAVPGGVWDQTVSDFVAAVKAGRVGDGLLAAIEACGSVLRSQHPAAPTGQ
jgi:putative membrane protein